MPTPPSNPGGRPRKYPDRGGKGAPALTLRLAPDLHAWVKDQGGPEYVRKLLEEQKRRSEDGWRRES
jgi:hypothetical protein